MTIGVVVFMLGVLAGAGVAMWVMPPAPPTVVDQRPHQICLDQGGASRPRLS
jgi:hypothetical protein